MLEADIKRIAFALEELVNIAKEKAKAEEDAVRAEIERKRMEREDAQREVEREEVKEALEHRKEKKKREKLEQIKEVQKKREDDLEAQEEVETEEYTREQVREALMAAAEVIGQVEARELLLSVGGADTLGKLDPAEYGRVYRAAMDASELKD